MNFNSLSKLPPSSPVTFIRAFQNTWKRQLQHRIHELTGARCVPASLSPWLQYVSSRAMEQGWLSESGSAPVVAAPGELGLAVVTAVAAVLPPRGKSSLAGGDDTSSMAVGSCGLVTCKSVAPESGGHAINRECPQPSRTPEKQGSQQDDPHLH